MTRRRTRLSCTTSPQIVEAVEQLLWTGLYGNCRAEVVERLLGEAIAHKIASGMVRVGDLPRGAKP